MTVSRNGYRINTTEPNQMILLSFFLEDNVLFDEINTCYISKYQSNKNQAFNFFGTPGISLLVVMLSIPTFNLYVFFHFSRITKIQWKLDVKTSDITKYLI